MFSFYPERGTRVTRFEIKWLMFAPGPRMGQLWPLISSSLSLCFPFFIWKCHLLHRLFWRIHVLIQINGHRQSLEYIVTCNYFNMSSILLNIFIESIRMIILILYLAKWRALQFFRKRKIKNMDLYVFLRMGSGKAKIGDRPSRAWKTFFLLPLWTSSPSFTKDATKSIIKLSKYVRSRPH